MNVGLTAALVADLRAELARMSRGTIAVEVDESPPHRRWLTLVDYRGETVAAVTTTPDHLGDLRRLHADFVGVAGLRVAA